MFKKAGKKTSKVLAYLLALMVMVGYVPAELLLTAMAADTVDYTFKVTNGLSDGDLVKYENAEIVIKKDDVQVGETLTTNADGEATAEGLDDATEYSYTVTLLGYEDATGSFTTDSATDPKDVNVTMTALEEATITGTITVGTDAYEGATVTLSGYSEASATTDENGEYTLSGYVGKAYTVTVTPKAEDEAKYSEKTFTIDSAVETNDSVNFELVKNTHQITVSTNNTNDLTMGSVVIKDKATGTEIADLSNIDYGTEVVVEVTTEAGYGIVTDSFKVGGATKTLTDGKYEFTVDGNTTVSVEFEKTVFDLTIDANFEDEKGSIKFYKGNDEITTGKANKDDVITVKVDADEAYLVKSMTINSALYENSSEKEVTVTEDLTVTANFEAKVFEVEFFVTGKGKIEFTDDNDTIAGVVDVVETPQGKVDEIGYNGELVFNVIANSGEGYHIESIESSSDKMVIDNTNDTTIIGENDCIEKNVEISEITANETVTVKFAINTYTVTGGINNTDLTSTADGSISVENGDTFNYGDDVTIKFKPTNNNKSQKRVSALTINKFAEDGSVISSRVLSTSVSDNDINYNAEEKLCVLKDVNCDIKVSVLFDNIEQLVGDWEDHVSITPEYVYSTTDDDNKIKTYIYSGEITITPKDAETYNKGVDFLVDENKEFEGMQLSRKITESTTISLLQVQRKKENEKSINLEGYKLVLLIDETQPTVNVDHSELITNKQSVTISGTATDVNVDSNAVLGLDRVVYTTGEKPADETAVKALVDKATLTTDGKFEINVKGTTELNTTYYIYAIDVAGNVSEAKEVKVVIDKVAPVISDITFPANTNVEKDTDGNIIKVSSIQAFDMTVTANDVTEITEGEGESAITTPVVSASLKNAVITYKQNGEFKEPISIDFTNDTVTQLISEGTYTDVYVSVYDNAGNESAKKGPYTLVVDNSDFKTTENSVIVNALDGNKKHETADEIWFANENVELNFKLSHTNSYVKPSKVVVSVNGADFSCEDVNANDDIYSYSCKFINTDGTSALSDGENKVKITVTSSTKQVTTLEDVAVFYIDKTPATIEKFDFAVKNQNKGAELINFLTFGIFCNQQIEVTVTAADTGAGVNTITLFADGESLTETPVAVDSENKATFTIPANVVTDDALHFNKIISAVATDNVGNTTKEKVAPHEKNSDIKLSGLMIETVKPEISAPVITATDTNVTLESYTADDKTWYNTDVDFAFSITDGDSGIRSVEVAINGKPITEDKTGIDIKNDYYSLDEKTIELEFVVSTSQAKAKENGSYTLTVDVIDNAGNVAETKTVTVYKDVAVPEIDGFKFEGIDDKQPCVETAEYGFYFKQDTKVTISATDEEPTSGIKEITYYTVDVDNGKSIEVAEQVNENGEIEIEIKANFKGQIYAKVNDNVLNTTSKFVSPDKTVVESEDKHKEETHIAFKTEVEPTGKTSAEKDNDLYATDVPVTITVIDTYSGIESIEWSVVAPYDTDNNQKGSVTVLNDGTLEGDRLECDSWNIDATDSNLITKMSKTINVNNNSNDIKVLVTMTDRAGNTDETPACISFSIDKTAPVIEVTYDNNTPDATYNDFYKANRTATITVTERNFNADDVKVVIENTDGVIPALSEWTAVENKEDPDKTTYTATIDYVADGDYTFDIDYSDRATNVAKYVVENTEEKADDFTPHAFTIDKTRPVVKVTYDNNKALNKNYYAAERTATITVTEHNFKYIDENGKEVVRVNVNGKATDNGKKVTFPAIKGWTSNGDVHTATISYKADAKYIFDIEILDLAGNSIKDYKQEEFYIDKTAPEVEITGVANNSANNGKVAPVVNYTDTNFTEDGVTVTLTGVNRGRVDYSRGVAKVANGQTMSYENFRNVKEVDDIYTLTAKVVDKAGNETTKTISFSVNRFGSTYNLEAVKSYNNKYIQSMGDLVFTEVNVNSLDLGNIRVKLTKNGTPSDLVMNQDFTVDVAGGGGRWYTYTYTIKSALFQDDAKYSLSFYSVDASGNVNENIDETKEAVVSFAVDKTKPVIIPIDLADGERYKETVKNVTIEVKDNLLLENVKIYLNDSEVEYTVEGESYTIQVPESTERQTIKIVAVDAAGNEYETVVKDFLVSTNAFVQFVNNTPVFIGSIVALVAVIGAVIAFIVLGKKKRRK